MQSELGKNTRKDGRGDTLAIVAGVVLLAVTAGLGFGAYSGVNYFEVTLRNEEYRSLAKQLETSILKSMGQKVRALNSYSQTIAMVCPDAAQWPNCSVPMKSFFNITEPLSDMGDLRTLSFAPIITPDQVPQFEAFAYKTFEDQGYEGLGVSSFGKGISAVNTTSGKRYHDTQGTNLNSKYEVLTPVIQIGNLDENRAAVMFNLYSQESRISAIDFMMDCFNAGGRGSQCMSITDVIHLVQDPIFRPAVLVIHPVTAVNDPDTLVGLDSGVFNWDIVFGSSLAEYVSGVVVVLRGGKKTYTFELNGGSAILQSDYDDHDPAYDSTSRHFDIPYFAGSTLYSVSIYQSDKFSESYRTDLPIYACVITIVIMLFVVAMLALYDQSMKRKAAERELVMDTKRQFVRFISHEIRTPINIVYLGLKLVSKEITETITNHVSSNSISTETLLPMMTDWVQLVSDMRRSADNAIVVLNDLINYDKINLGGMQIEPKLILVWKLVKDSIQPFYLQARQADIVINVDIDTERSDNSDEDRESLSELFMVADPIKMTQVLRNIISNALKFGKPKSTVDIKASYKRGGLSANNVEEMVDGVAFKRTGSLVFSVTDYGAGISATDQKSLFKEGLQFRANQLQAGGGSGLGLWISKGIVQLHHGTIVASSDGEGCGSTFTIEVPVGSIKDKSAIPIEDIELDTIEYTPAVLDRLLVAMSIGMKIQAVDLFIDGSNDHAKAEEVETEDDSKKHVVRNILVVDDSALSRKMVVRTLKHHNYTCFEAVDGQDCLDKYDTLLEEGVHIDAILMDYEMPVMNGPTATQELKKRGVRCPIIGITGNVLPAEIQQFIHCGALEVLPKPLSLPELERILGPVLQCTSSITCI